MEPYSYQGLMHISTISGGDMTEYDDFHDTCRERIKELEAKVDQWENREAAVCPEDVPFEEYLRSKDRRIKELEAELAKAQNLLGKYMEQEDFVTVTYRNDNTRLRECLRQIAERPLCDERCPAAIAKDFLASAIKEGE